MLVNDVYELFSLDSRAFIVAAYVNLLEREPDEHGLAYYLGRLSVGYSKVDIIVQLAKSPECRPHGEIDGLVRLIASEHRAHHWLWGVIGRWDRLIRALSSVLFEMDNGFSRIAQRLESLQSGLSHLAPIDEHLGALHKALLSHAKQLENLAQEVVHAQASAGPLTQAVDYRPRLPEETVRQAFLSVLGREPESEEVIKTHARHDSVEALREVLLNSEEFKRKLVDLPEYARSIFMRQIQLSPAQHGE